MRRIFHNRPATIIDYTQQALKRLISEYLYCLFLLRQYTMDSLFSRQYSDILTQSFKPMRQHTTQTPLIAYTIHTCMPWP